VIMQAAMTTCIVERWLGIIGTSFDVKRLGMCATVLIEGWSVGAGDECLSQHNG
jgi:hypothetical protein